MKKRMKKLMSLVLALGMASSASAYTVLAQEDEIHVHEAGFGSDFATTRVVEGTVKEIRDGQIELEELVLNIDENTLIAGCDLVPVTLKEGDKVVAVANMAQTFSIPPQSYAHNIIVKKTDDEIAPLYMEVEKVEDGFIYSIDGNYKVSYENAQVEMYRTKNIVKAEELTAGSAIFVYADMMTMSIPALVNPSKIVIKEFAPAEETDVVISEETAEKRVVEGVIEAVEEGRVELNDLVLNIDENTLIAGCDLVPVELEVGDAIFAITDSVQTLSLPPQTYAYYIIVKKNAQDAAPIYMTVDKVENGMIYSEDGMYELTFEGTHFVSGCKCQWNVEHFRKGDEILVYSDTMTMSIPALLNPSKVVILSAAADEENSKAAALNEQGIMLGTDKGLELEREVTRAEAVTLIQRTSQVPRMAYVSNFDDVPSDHWAYINISWATQTGIVQGVGDNKFEPNRTVNAKELSMMLLNAQHIEAEFEDAFEKAFELGYITAEDEIEEDDVLTRDAVAKMIYNYLER